MSVLKALGQPEDLYSNNQGSDCSDSPRIFQVLRITREGVVLHVE
jgi:hypothetical protein